MGKADYCETAIFQIISASMSLRNNLRILTCTLFGVFMFQTAFCQENYLPGFIISLKEDTVKGFVDYRNWDKTPKLISFKTGNNQLKSEFSPLDIKEFTVNNERYVSAIVETEISPSKVINMQYISELQLRVDTTFLESMIMGSKSLYYLKNQEGNENFYIGQESKPELLLYKKYYQLKDGGKVVKENKKYREQLSFYLEGCSSLGSKIANTPYSKKSMEKLFDAYYSCTQTDMAFKKETEKTGVEIGVIAGASLTSVKFRSDHNAFLVNANYNRSSNFAAGLFLDMIIPRTQSKLSFYNELNFTSYQVNGVYTTYEDENKHTSTFTEFGYSYLKLNTMARFKYPVGKAYVYINGGMSNGYAVKEINYSKQETKFYTEERTVEDAAIKDTRRYEQGFILGLGVRYNRYAFEARSEKGNGMSLYSGLGSHVDRYHFLLSYRF
ncbi:hypothetical protein D770_25815 [Flammeovirgaceae bacterium 311]|nr:hypothetical protein D770_25815 [Flammeovirgaceae bacterium 311]